METLTIWLGAVMTLCIFSFLYNDNPLYKFAEHLLVGVSAGYCFSTIAVHQVLKPNLLAKLWPKMFAVGEKISGEPQFLLLIPAMLGFLMFFRLSSRFAWISRFTVAFVMGIVSGLWIVYCVQQNLLPQMRKCIVPLFIAGDPFGTFSNWVLLIGSIACLFYFFFSVEHKGPVFGGLSRVGICYLMISFGAAFGATVMSRISLLIGRFQFLLIDWLHLV
ncbi:MAG: hypothetical protein WA705_16605 [Candidatus Ozemobacteraceae bacterium]